MAEDEKTKEAGDVLSRLASIEAELKWLDKSGKGNAQLAGAALFAVLLLWMTVREAGNG